MSDFVKELNFDGDTFNDMKRDMNFVLQRLLGNMQEKECQEGTCRQCGRRILWVRMKSGKNMLVDMALHNYKKDSTGKEKIVTPGGEVVTGRTLVGERGDGAGYISHFASCKKYRR